MLLKPHAAFLRIETIRAMLALGREPIQVAALLGVTKQTIYADINNYKLNKSVAPISIEDIPAYIKYTLQPEIKQYIVDARVVEKLLHL